ncbi:MAG: Spy/CpxP family protein refolding chaperone [Paucibacter sp.]|nr:Spy/CpxP family protein refolding chaperone [Roseateles sp.]
MTISNTSNLIRTGKTLAVAAALALSSLGAMNAQAMGPMDRMARHGGDEMMMAGRIEHMLDMVDASDAQRAQIKQIMGAAKQDLKAQRGDGRGLHEQAMALLTAPNIDAAAVESLRVQISAQRETASKRMSQAMVDAARVLTPEQRAKMAERMKKMQARMSEHRAEHQHKSGKGQ